MQMLKNEKMKIWIILDSVSTVNLFFNPNIFNNINEVDEEMHPAKNSRVKINNHKAEVPQYGELWYYKQSITNIFSLKDMIKKHRVTIDLNVEYWFKINLLNKILKFKIIPDVLYYCISPNVFFFFFFWAGLRDPISWSFWGGWSPPQNSGYNITRLCHSLCWFSYYFVFPCRVFCPSSF